MPDLLLEKSGHVARTTRDRPERLNAIGVATLEPMTRALEAAAAGEVGGSERRPAKFTGR